MKKKYSFKELKEYLISLKNETDITKKEIKNGNYDINFSKAQRLLSLAEKSSRYGQDFENFGDYYPAPVFTWRENFAQYMNQKTSESELWDTATANNYFYYKENYDGIPVFHILNGSKEVTLIPFKYIDTTKIPEFYSKGTRYYSSSESFDYYKIYLKK